MKIPPVIIAGDTVSWTDVTFLDNQGNSISGIDYSLAYSFRGPGATLDLTGTQQGSGWAFTMSATQSAALNAGAANLTWYWAAYATKSGTRITAGDGTLVVKPNLSALTSTNFDGSSPAELILKAIETEISARISGGATLEYTIGTRSLKKEPMSALLELRSTYRNIVARERRGQMIKNGLGNPGRVGVRFK